MKDHLRFFERSYSSVKTDEPQAQSSACLDAQRRKSLKAQRSVNPAGILNSFFNERDANHRARSPKCAFCLLTVGLLAIVIAILVKVLHPYDMIFRYKLVMEKDGEIFNLWEKPPVDLYIKIYLFNITNAEAFLAGKEPMNVEQVGPYVYKEIMTHENVTFLPNNTMSTKPSHPLVWQADLSEGHKEDDEVVMLNIAMLAISHLTVDKSFFARMAINVMTTGSSPIVRMTAKEFMFGYKSSLTTIGNTFLPQWINFSSVGLIDRMYDFNTDFETFFTGVPDPSVAGLYDTYRGNTNLPHWHGDHCSNIQYASDGTKFKSFIQPNETVKFFRKSMCRPITLHRSGEPRQYGSLKGYSYVFEENALDNGVINEKNKCYCRHGKCQPAGLIDVTDCYYGFPISLSYPHFMDGDIGLQTNVTGLQPDKKKHSSEFVIQPESGLPLSLSAKVQINMHFNDMSAFSKLSAFSHLTAPMLWFEIMMPELPDALDARFNFYLNLLPYLDILGFWGGLIVGISMLVYAVTRATIRLSTIAAHSNNISDHKFGQANLLRSAAAGLGGNGVYKACEMKLLQSNEKKAKLLPPTILPTKQKQRVIIRNDEQPPEDENPNTQLIYSEQNEKQRRLSVFALEMEPTLSAASDSSDEDTIASSSTACINEDLHSNCKELSLSRSSSGMGTSLASSRSETSSYKAGSQNSDSFEPSRNLRRLREQSSSCEDVPLHNTHTRPASLPPTGASENCGMYKV